MGHILSEIIPFLASVFEHWHIWLSGGGIGGIVLIGSFLIEKLFEKTLSKRQTVYLLIFTFILGSCFLSWVDKDDALKASEVAKENQHDQYSRLLAQAHNDYAQLRADCAYQKGVVDTLSTQNRDQQNSINQCQTEAIKRIIPDAENHAVVEVRSPYQKPNSETYIFLTNKSFPAASIQVTCDKSIENLWGNVMGTNITFQTPPTLVAPNTWVFAVSSPQWTPLDPVQISFAYSGTTPKCSFRKN